MHHGLFEIQQFTRMYSYPPSKTILRVYETDFEIGLLLTTSKRDQFHNVSDHMTPHTYICTL